MSKKTSATHKKPASGPVEMTQEAFDQLIEQITMDPEPMSDWFPSQDEIDSLIQDLPDRKTLEFCIWITESNPDMDLTDIQKEGRKRLRKAISDSVVIKD